MVSGESVPRVAVVEWLAPSILAGHWVPNAYLNRPGPRLVDAAETIAAWLRGQRLVDPLVKDASSLEARRESSSSRYPLTI